MEYGVEIWGWEEKSDLEKIMFDYVRWLFGIEFCTPRYLIFRELRLLKLNAVWGIRANRFEERIRTGRTGKIAKEYWLEKKYYGWKDRYGEEKEKFLVSVGWDTGAEEGKERYREEKEKEAIEMVRCKMRREEEERIIKSRYNPRYKELMVVEGRPRYLKEGNLKEIEKGEEIRALVKLRCGNLENVNKYWLKDNLEIYVFCKKEMDTLEHYVGECEKTKGWFRELGDSDEEILGKLWEEDLDESKGKILKKL